MKTATKDKDVSGSKPEGHAATSAAQTNDSSEHRPIWDRQLNRVKAAMWTHPQKDKTRYTVAIYRSYKDAADGKWKNVYYFDSQDLQDVRALCDEAAEKVSQLDGMAVVAGEA
jgi:hypothetical protein